MKKYHIFYKTTNLVTKEIYYGIHSANVRKDKYLGSGTGLKEAVKKYGRNNFVRKNVKIFNTREEASEYEQKFVTERLCNIRNVYNRKTGGEGKFLEGGSFSEEMKQKLKNIWKDTHHPHTEETKRKMSESHKGEKNYLYQKHHTQKWIDDLKQRCKNRIKMYYPDKEGYKWIQKEDIEENISKGLLLECKEEYKNRKVYVHKGVDIQRVDVGELEEWQAKGYVRGKVRDRSYMGSTLYRELEKR